MTYDRPGWDDTFLEIVEVIGKRGTCGRGRSGCVITRDNRIISTGYVGAPSKMPHCDDIGHQIVTVEKGGVKTEHCVRSIHAEMNAILSAARNGISLNGAIMYCTMVPCSTCAKNITNAGIKKVVALYDYQGAAETLCIFKTSGVELIVKNGLKEYE